MAAFKFRLASVLQYRERIKEEKQWQLRALNEAKRKIEEGIRLLERELRQTEEAVTGKEGQICSVSEFRLLADHASRLSKRIREKHSLLKACEQELVEKRAEVVEALRAVKTLQQLRNRLEEKFHREQEIMEQKLADEIGQREFSSTRQKLP